MSNTSAYSFLELDDTEFSNLKLNEQRLNLIETLKRNSPETVQFLNVIQIKQQKLHSVENIAKIQFFSCEKGVLLSKQKQWDDPNRPLFLVCIIRTKYEFETGIYNLVYCRDDPTPGMMDAFAKLFDWSKEIHFGTINARFAPFLEKLVQTLNSKGIRGEIGKHPNWTMCLPKPAKPLSSIQMEGVSVRRLKPEEAVVVDSHWKFSGKGSLLQIQDSIKYFISAGVFIKSNDSTSESSIISDEEMACWIVSLPIGTLNAMLTKEKYRRNGFGELTMKEACRQAFELGLTPLCEVEFESLASKAMLDKMGFKIAYDACWMFFKPSST